MSVVALASRIDSGTSEMQRNIIARYFLGYERPAACAVYARW